MGNNNHTADYIDEKWGTEFFSTINNYMTVTNILQTRPLEKLFSLETSRRR